MNKPYKFRRKPLDVEAIRWDGINLNEVLIFMGSASATYHGVDLSIDIHTSDGVIKVPFNDYIIKGPRGEFYSCKSDIFNETYDRI